MPRLRGLAYAYGATISLCRVTHVARACGFNPAIIAPPILAAYYNCRACAVGPIDIC